MYYFILDINNMQQSLNKYSPIMIQNQRYQCYNF